MLLNDDKAGKPEGIHVSAGGPTRRSAIRMATGRCWNTPGLVTARGCRCWSCMTTPSANMPTARRKGCRRPRSALSPQALYDEAKKKSWTVISMKNDWKKIFAFE